MSIQFAVYALIVSLVFALAALAIGPRRLFAPHRLIGIFFLTFILTYLFRPALTNVQNDVTAYYLYRVSRFEEQPWPVTIAVVAATISLVIGYRAGLRRGIVGKPSPAVWTRYGKNYPKMALLLIAGSLLYGYTALFLFGGIASMVETPGGSVYTETTGYLVLGDVIIGPALVLMSVVTQRITPSFVLAAPWLLSRIRIGWSRHLVLVFALGLLMSWILQGKNRKKRDLALISIVVVMAMAIIPLIESNRYFFRETVTINQVVEQLTSEDTRTEITGSGSPIAGFEQTVAVLSTWREFRYGLSYLYNYVIMPIPRMLWSGKPTNNDMRPLLLYAMGQAPKPETGLSSSGWRGTSYEWYGSTYGAIGEAFSELGWFGIVFIFLLNGYLLGFVEERFDRSSKSPALVTAYAGFYAILPLTGRVNLLSTGQTWLVYFGILCLVIWWVEQRAVRRAERLPGTFDARPEISPRTSL